MGIPTLILGIGIILIRIFMMLVINIIASEIGMINALINPLLKPILMTGIICFIVGLLMIIAYNIINKKIKENKKEELVSQN